MFRRVESSLPGDFHFGDTLEDMGYFINDKDQIRMIEDPEQEFHYHASKNERFVDRQREAFNELVRNIILRRMANLNVGTLPLPYKPKAPSDEPHIPILASSNLDTATRIVVFVGELQQDLGWFAGRIINMESINKGSAVNLAYDVLVDPSSKLANEPLETRGLNKIDKSDMSKTALVLANPGQLIWWHRGKKAMTYQSWNAIPRKYGPGDGPLMSAKNKVPRNNSSSDHVVCLFEDFLYPLKSTGVKIDIITAGDGMESVTSYLDANWFKWKDAVEAMVCCTHNNMHPHIYEDAAFTEWWGKRARIYAVEASPLGQALSGRTRTGCNIYSAGVDDFVECIVPRAYGHFLEYFKEVHENPNYANEPQDFPEEPVQETPTWAMEGEGAGDVNIDVPLDGNDADVEKAVEVQLGQVAKPA